MEMKTFEPCVLKNKSFLKPIQTIRRFLGIWGSLFTNGEEMDYFLYKTIYVMTPKGVFNLATLALIDSLNIHIFDRLVAVWFYENQLYFLWKYFVPKEWVGQAVLLASNGELGVHHTKAERLTGQYVIHKEKSFSGICIGNISGGISTAYKYSLEDYLKGWK